MTAAPGALRLLYIDDDGGFARLVTKALARQAIEVCHADGGEAGLARLDEGGWDAVALDHFMPGLSGEETLARIVERAGAPPVVYVTGANEGRIAVAALKAGAADYVVKEVGESFFDLLGATIRHAVAAARVAAEKEAAVTALAEARDRAELLLKEVNHRVANSLALVSSLAHLQAGMLASGEAREALVAFQRRVTAIGQVHKRLYTSDHVGEVALDQYLSSLIADLSASLSGAGCVARVRLSAEPVMLQTDRAISVGIAVSELVTNACKYAYGPGDPGEIRVALARAPGGLVLAVEDDGRGIDGGGAQGTGLGGRILAAMAKGLRGRIVQPARVAGTRVELHLPDAG